ncbi:DNA-binding transcriptional LysR family regulator [Shimia isoporae]|uniref:DNA-binding transcriptional LysR family regulator n=1 Tax=Shimia isoporae TaxID=647720 RepID=A0A4R1N7M5_9RHOB|nr:LysR family transcriptional regulator [Shimia isoporae]TCK99288.1 DNA-binding transcriptional LysR family regulator [Shimia isoporae]
MSINYDFGDLEAFLAVKETGSFHAASERLNLSQSAVTRRIQKLEEALDSQLFERTTRAVKPTLAAKRLQARAEAILQDAEETARAMRDESVAFAHQRNTVITVASIPTVIGRIVIPALKAFGGRRPSARIRVIDVPANEVAEAVAEGDADFGISSIPALDPAIEFDPLFDESIVLAVPAKHPLKTKSQVDWGDFQKEALILPARGTGNRLLIDEAMARARQTAVWQIEVGRTSTALEMVQEGLGVALVPESAGKAADVHFVPFADQRLSRSIGILRRHGQVETDLVAGLKAHIRRAVAAI